MATLGQAAAIVVMHRLKAEGMTPEMEALGLLLAEELGFIDSAEDFLAAPEVMAIIAEHKATNE